MARSAYEKGGKMIGDANRLQALARTFESGDYDASLALANDYVNTYPEDMEARSIYWRAKLKTSPVMDEVSYVKEVEELYRGIVKRA